MINIRKNEERESVLLSADICALYDDDCDAGNFGISSFLDCEKRLSEERLSK